MPEFARDLEMAVWAVAENRASARDRALYDADEKATIRTLERLIDRTEDDLDAVSGLPGPERDQVIADFEDTLDALWDALDVLVPPPPEPDPAAQELAERLIAAGLPPDTPVLEEPPGE